MGLHYGKGTVVRHFKTGNLYVITGTVKNAVTDNIDYTYLPLDTYTSDPYSRDSDNFIDDVSDHPDNITGQSLRFEQVLVQVY